MTTCPDYGSRNVGDKLIELRTRKILRREKGEEEFLVIFREEPLDEWLDQVNASRAVLMPAFPIRDTPMHPGTYRLVDELARIRVPMVPVGANWNVYPGDAETRRQVKYSDETTRFLKYIAGQVDPVSCREYLVQRVLQKHGVPNTVMTGDPAMFCLECLGKAMKRPAAINRIVFSPPLSPYYAEQAEALMRMLFELFPEACRYCAFHLASSTTQTGARGENSAAMSPVVAEKDRRIRRLAEELAFECIDLAGDPDGLSLYDRCDLHVGYECHAHLYFLSMRSPSVLIAEDARGIGFNYTLGVGGFDGFERRRDAGSIPRKAHTSGYCTSPEELAIARPRTGVDTAVKVFLEEELEAGFRRYVGLASYLDEMYEKCMRPFIKSLP